MALFRAGGSSVKKFVVVEVEQARQRASIVYDNGSGVNSAYIDNITSYTNSDLVDVSYSGSTYTITAKASIDGTKCNIGGTPSTLTLTAGQTDTQGTANGAVYYFELA